MCLEDTIGFFDIKRIFGQFESVRQRGIRFTVIMTALLVMLFYRSRNIHSYFSQQYGKKTGREGSKNPYYDLLGSEHINWRSILYLFAKRYLSLSGRIAAHSGKTRALIFDDSPIEKSGKKIEAVSKMHDHVTGRFIFGYKLLVCGYWDGNNFIPVDFSLHRERGSELDRAREKRNHARRKARQAEVVYQDHRAQYLEKRAVLNSLRDTDSKNSSVLEYEKQKKRVSRSKKEQAKLRKRMKLAQAILEEKEELVRIKEKQAPLYGLTSTQRKKQYRKNRDKATPGYQLRSEAYMSKTQSVINMLSRAVKRGFEFDYVLFASWFFSKEIQYTHQTAISNDRIMEVNDQTLTFTWKDYHHDYKTRFTTMVGEEFLNLFCQHIMPPGFTRIRHFGFLSSASKKKSLPIIRAALMARPMKTRENQTIQEDAFEKMGIKPGICNSCGGKMKIIEIIKNHFHSTARAPPDNCIPQNIIKRCKQSF